MWVNDAQISGKQRTDRLFVASIFIDVFLSSIECRYLYDTTVPSFLSLFDGSRMNCGGGEEK